MEVLSDEAHAVSFANGYFCLADGLANDLNHHLADDVLLDWFGRTIKGKTNVVSFFKLHKMDSTHLFTNITPTTSISYRKKRLDKGMKESGNNDSGLCTSSDNDQEHSNDKVYEMSTEEDADVMNNNNGQKYDSSFVQIETNMKESSEESNDVTYDSNENELEITTTKMEEIEASINRIKLEEEIAPTIKVVKGECGQGDGPDVMETSSIKYMEANGKIQFSRRSRKRAVWNECESVTPSFTHTWKRECKLQIAYSILNDDQCKLKVIDNLETHSSWKAYPIYKQPFETNLPTLDEINEISNSLVPNPNCFNGYLKTAEAMRTEILSQCGDNFNKIAPRYVNNKLVLDRPCDHSTQEKELLFNYQIHLIIYESKRHCRVKLVKKFEKKE